MNTSQVRISLLIVDEVVIGKLKIMFNWDGLSKKPVENNNGLVHVAYRLCKTYKLVFI